MAARRQCSTFEEKGETMMMMMTMVAVVVIMMVVVILMIKAKQRSGPVELLPVERRDRTTNASAS